MKFVLFSLILAQINPVREYVERNYDAIVGMENLIGTGSSSNVYGFKFNGKSLALKEYRDIKRSKKEISFLGAISCLDLPVPAIHYKSVSRSVTVMDRLGETLRTYLHRHIGNKDVLQKLVNALFNAMTMLHEKGIVHGNIHLDNIMVENEKIFFIDFDESFISTDCTLDIMRLNYYVLSKINDWEMLVDTSKLKNPESFEIIRSIYHEPRITLMFKAAAFFDIPGVQYWTYKLLTIPTSLKSLIGEYNNRIRNCSIKSSY